MLVDGHGAAWGEPVSLPAGAVLRVGPARRGVRSYVAVAGGLDVPPVLGSRATDRLSGLGPPPLADGRGAARRTRTPARTRSTYRGWPRPTACSGWRPGRGRTG